MDIVNQLINQIANQPDLNRDQRRAISDQARAQAEFDVAHGSNVKERADGQGDMQRLYGQRGTEVHNETANARARAAATADSYQASTPADAPQVGYSNPKVV